jgi:hypothetical protein
MQLFIAVCVALFIVVFAAWMVAIRKEIQDVYYAMKDIEKAIRDMDEHQCNRRLF